MAGVNLGNKKALAKLGLVLPDLQFGLAVELHLGQYHILLKKKINKKERHLAILLALALKKKDILIISDNILNLEKPKTKSLVKILESLSILKTEKILLITSTLFENLVYASNNLVNVNLSSPTNLSLQQLLCANKLIFSVSAHNLIKESYEKYYK